MELKKELTREQLIFNIKRQLTWKQHYVLRNDFIHAKTCDEIISSLKSELSLQGGDQK